MHCLPVAKSIAENAYTSSSSWKPAGCQSISVLMRKQRCCNANVPHGIQSLTQKTISHLVNSQILMKIILTFWFLKSRRFGIERHFYQKITDIYATAVDYSLDSQTTKDL